MLLFFSSLHSGGILNIDTNGDLIIDSIDLDDDNDGILDSVECTIIDSNINGAIASSDLSFSITSNNPNDASEPHVLNSITILGKTYSSFIYNSNPIRSGKPYYTVSCTESDPSTWTGIGSTGNIIEGRPHNNSKRKIDW